MVIHFSVCGAILTSTSLFHTGGLMLAVQNQALCEEAEQTTVQDEDGAPPSPSVHETSIGKACFIFI